jgi:hypothetical protein
LLRSTAYRSVSWVPTRLIDWTYSAAAALWFAVKDGEVLDRETTARHGGRFEHYFHGVVWLLKSVKQDFPDLDKTNPFKITRTALYRPRVIGHRIQAQSGLFSVHAVKERYGKPDFIPLEINKVLTSRLIRIPIEAAKFAKLRKELDVLGVNESTMYPNLDGVCKHLQWRYTKKQFPEIMLQQYPGFFDQLDKSRRKRGNELV